MTFNAKKEELKEKINDWIDNNVCNGNQLDEIDVEITVNKTEEDGTHHTLKFMLEGFVWEK